MRPAIGHFLCLLSLAILSTKASGERPGDASAYRQTDRSAALERDVSFVNPPEIEAGAQYTTVGLRVSESVSSLSGVELRHRSYNGGLVGPTIRVRRGQTLKVRLQNELAAEPSSPHEPNEPHGFNTTNLHTHGWHVSPRSPADDVFLEVCPGETFDFEFSLSKQHPAGTFWYHPHKHGSTALQLASGMSGALIVEGGLDDIPEIRAAREQILVLQQFTYREIEGEPAVVDPQLLYSGEGNLVEAVNGVVTPTIVLRPGELQRWRVIHAGTVEAMRLDADGVTFWEVAVDGLATGRRVEMNSIRLFPGNRSDVLVQAPQSEGTHLLTSYLRRPEDAISRFPREQRAIVRIVVAGDRLPMAPPSDESLRLAAAFDDSDVPTDGELTGRRTLTFSGTSKPLLIDGKAFDPADIAQRLTLGDAEEWELLSTSGTHPFHIHVNPFAVKPQQPGQPWVWRDTVVLERNKPVIIRMRFTEHTGKSVLHCHNLVHEDLGMMQALCIDDPASATACPQTGVARLAAPAWEARDLAGVVHSSRELSGETALIVFHRGINCLHCADQLRVLQEGHAALVDAGVRLVAISPNVPQDEESVEAMAAFPFPMLLDPTLKSFRSFGCLDGSGNALHGVFLVDRSNHVHLRRVSETAIADPLRLVFAALQQESGAN